MMRRLVTVMAALAAIAAFGGTGTPARAQGAPYCISGDTSGAGNSLSSCIYMSYRQCQHTVRDTGRSCVRNPGYVYGSRFDDSYAMIPAYSAPAYSAPAYSTDIDTYSYDTGPTVRYIVVPPDY